MGHSLEKGEAESGELTQGWGRGRVIEAGLRQFSVFPEQGRDSIPGWGTRSCMPQLERSYMLQLKILLAASSRSYVLQLRPGAANKFIKIKNIKKRNGDGEGGSGWGTHVHPWLIHVNVWQKPPQYFKVINLQLK